MQGNLAPVNGLARLVKFFLIVGHHPHRAAGMEIPAEQLERLRPQCVRNVKKTSGSISLDSAVERQER